MGIFDPPTKSIAKRVPVSAQMSLTAVQSLAEIMLPEDLGRTKHASLTAIVMGYWVNAHANAGSFDMLPRDLLYIQNMTLNCGRVVGEEYWRTREIIEKLIASNMMPDGFEEYYRSFK